MSITPIEYVWWVASAVLTFLALRLMEERKFDLITLKTYLWFNLFRYSVLIGVYHTANLQVCAQWYMCFKVVEQVFRMAICYQVVYRLLHRNKDLAIVYSLAVTLKMVAVFVGAGFWGKLQAASFVGGFMVFMAWIMSSSIPVYYERLMLAIAIYFTAQAVGAFWPGEAYLFYPPAGVLCMGIWCWSIRSYGESLTMSATPSR